VSEILIREDEAHADILRIAKEVHEENPDTDFIICLVAAKKAYEDSLEPNNAWILKPRE
jgi:hypothetical protein